MYYNFPWRAERYPARAPWGFVLRTAALIFYFFFFGFCAGWAGAVGSAGGARPRPEPCPRYAPPLGRAPRLELAFVGSAIVLFGFGRSAGFSSATPCAQPPSPRCARSVHLGARALAVRGLAALASSSPEPPPPPRSVGACRETPTSQAPPRPNSP